MPRVIGEMKHYVWRGRNHLRRRWERARLEVDIWHSLSKLRKLKSSLAPGQELIAIGLIEHFGDIVASEPVARYIRQQHPDAYIIWIIRSGFRDLMESHPAINRVFIVSSITQYSRVLQKGPFDRVIDLHVNQKPCDKFGVTHVNTRGDARIDFRNYFFHGSLLQAFSKAAGIPELSEGPRIHLPKRSYPGVDEIAKGGAFIVVHPISNQPAKDWTIDKWIELLFFLSETFDVRLVEVGLRPSLSPLFPGLVDACGKLSLVELAELIRRSSGFIGIDSGPAHFANAFTRRSIILLGHLYAFTRYMPYTGFLRENAHEMLIHWDGPVVALPVKRVIEASDRVFGSVLVKKRPLPNRLN